MMSTPAFPRILEPPNCARLILQRHSPSPVIQGSTVHLRNPYFAVATDRGLNINFHVGVEIPPGRKALVQLSSIFQGRHLLHATNYCLFEGCVPNVYLFVRAVGSEPVVLRRGTLVCSVTLI